MPLQDLFQSRTGVVLVSIIWGLGLSTLFRKACQGQRCRIVTYRGPDPEQVRQMYHHFGGDQCYQYYPIKTPCRIR